MKLFRYKILIKMLDLDSGDLLLHHSTGIVAAESFSIAMETIEEYYENEDIIEVKELICFKNNRKLLYEIDKEEVGGDF